MKNQILPAIRMTLLLTVLTGVIYPALVTGIAKVVFPKQAAGSLIEVNGKIAGSELIGQKFTKPEYFHGRPSAAGDNGYDAANSSGSNLGPTNPKLTERIAADVAAFHKENPTATGPVPADLVTASASGLDPHISPAAALAQLDRVAGARAAAPAQPDRVAASPAQPDRGAAARVKALIDANTEQRTLGFIGEPRVNVLKLNLALDREMPIRK